MRFLVILKRGEVWLLAAVVFALLVVALRPEQAAVNNTVATVDPKVTGTMVEPVVPDPAETVSVRDVKVTGTKEGMIVELTVSGRSLSGEDLTLDESNVTATTGEGEPVNRFFEPFREPAVLLASEDSLATLKWWLERPTGEIWLDLQGQRVKVELP